MSHYLPGEVLSLSDKMRCFPSGRDVDPCDVQVADIDINDVAHHLSNICRFTGAVHSFYSVAQHSCVVAVILAIHNLPRRIQFAGIMHDTPEYLLNDCGTPLKKRLPEYRYYEDKAWPLFVERFQISDSYLTQRFVKAADEIAYRLEARILQGRFDAATELKSELLDVTLLEDFKILPMVPYAAREAFMRMYVELQDA